MTSVLNRVMFMPRSFASHVDVAVVQVTPRPEPVAQAETPALFVRVERMRKDSRRPGLTKSVEYKPAKPKHLEDGTPLYAKVDGKWVQWGEKKAA